MPSHTPFADANKRRVAGKSHVLLPVWLFHSVRPEAPDMVTTHDTLQNFSDLRWCCVRTRLVLHCKEKPVQHIRNKNRVAIALRSPFSAEVHSNIPR